MIIFSNNHIDVIICPEIFEEYKYVLFNSKLIDLQDAESFLQSLNEISIFCVISNSLDVCKDKSDNKFLEAAIEGSADYLVTKNIRHFPYKQYDSIKIVRVSKALKAIEESIQRTSTR